MNEVSTIGLIAGKGKLPIFFAWEVKKSNRRISAIGFKGITASKLAKYVDSIYWANLDRWEEIADFFKKEKIKQVVMLGAIKHSYIFNPWNFDQKTKELWDNLKDKKATTLLKASAQVLAEKGIEIVSPAVFLESFLAPEGILTKSEPSEQEWADIRFGHEIAKTLAGLDIGQTVIVKDQAVVAVEAMEGTDKCIIRAGKINRNGLIVVKVARPRQEMRFDPPVIGLNTIKILRKVRARVLACEAKKTLILEKEKLLEEADKNNLTIVAL